MADTSEWVVASAATEHTGKPELAENESTHDASSATEHADAAAGFEEVELQNADWPCDATEHADDLEDACILTRDDACKIRKDWTQGQVGRLHTALREHLNTITARARQEHATDVYYLDESIRWKEYIAMHPQCDKIIGTGIIAAHLERIHHALDANRQNNARVDYVFYRADNTFCRVHPGTRRKNDAQLVIADNSTCCRAVHVYDVAPKPMTFEATMQVPMHDKMGKAEAWRQLRQRDDALTDVTEYVISNGGFSCQISARTRT